MVKTLEYGASGEHEWRCDLSSASRGLVHDGCDRIIVDVQRGIVEAVLDHPDAPNEIWAFGIVRREVQIDRGAWIYLDGFNRLRRLRVHVEAAPTWLARFDELSDVRDVERQAAEQVAAIVATCPPRPPRHAPGLGPWAHPTPLAGLVALVTGASRGIGAAVARRLAAAGAQVVVTARTLDGHPAQSDESIDTVLSDTVSAIRAQGGTTEPFLADLTDPGTPDRLVASVYERFGRIDILVNNAARAVYRPLDGWDSVAVQKLFQVNVLSPFALARAVVPGMRARGFGSVVNVSSIVAEHPIGPPYGLFERSSHTTVYGMAKAALDRMSSGLAIECTPLDVRINSLSPSGGVRTPGALAASSMFNGFPELAEAPETMAEAVLALCEPGAHVPTGRVLTSGALLADLGRPVRGLDGGPFDDALALLDLRADRQSRLSDAVH